jgi:uncharacterized protein YcbX
MMPYLAKIWLYPIKSLDGIEVEKATILDRGSLEYDREFAFFDAENKFVNVDTPRSKETGILCSKI